MTAGMCWRLLESVGEYWGLLGTVEVMAVWGTVRDCWDLCCCCCLKPLGRDGSGFDVLVIVGNYLEVLGLSGTAVDCRERRMCWGLLVTVGKRYDFLGTVGIVGKYRESLDPVGQCLGTDGKIETFTV